MNDILKNEYDEIKLLENTKGSICILDKTWIKCNQLSIGSHSISKSNHLAHLTTNSKTKVYTLDKDNSNMILRNKYSQFKDVSYIKMASVFHGLCKAHDDIYYPIDKNFDYSNKSHLLLLAQRQVLYEYKKKEEVLKCFKRVKSILDNVKIFKITQYYKNIYAMIYKHIIERISFIEAVSEDLKQDINKFKEEFDIILRKTNKSESGMAQFKDNIKSEYIYTSIKFKNKFEFSFSSLFAPKYSFNGDLIYPNLNNIKHDLKTPCIGLINDKDHSYFYCICINNEENMKLIDSLTTEINSNINTLLKCALMTDNTFYSEDFFNLCKKSPTPITVFNREIDNKIKNLNLDTIDKLIGYLYLQDSINLTSSTVINGVIIDGELLRVKNLKTIDHLGLLNTNDIEDIIISYK
jgi:hypothetical protein